jgi:cleavage and polyadenylation specificity factor subunit 3
MSNTTPFDASCVHKIAKGEGKCLVPVFALGRAQELLLVLDEYWAANKELQRVPIYYSSRLAQQNLDVFKTCVQAGALSSAERAPPPNCSR